MAVISCQLATLSLHGQNVDSKVVSCNNIFTTTNTLSFDRNYVFLLEKKISSGIWSSREKKSLNTFEAIFSNLSAGFYRVSIIANNDPLNSPSLTKYTVTSSEVEVKLCVDDIKSKVSSNKSNFGKDDVMIYPNPTNTQLKVLVSKEIADIQPMIQIQNLIGQVLLTEKISNNLSELNLDYLENGLYLIKLSDGKTILYQDKFIIQKH